MSFQPIDYKDVQFNPFTMIADEWMLLTAGTQKAYNAMTVSWGHMGAIWGHGSGKPTAVVYVRPQRYTKAFLDGSDTFTLSVYDSSYKPKLAYLGSHSGRDGDKMKKVDFTPVYLKNGVYFSEAKLVFVCKKMYHGKLEEDGFVDPKTVSDFYPEKDLHEVYIGEVTQILKKTD